MDGKFYYTIGEVAEIMQHRPRNCATGVEKFHLNVRKNRKGDRLFQKDDLEKLR